MDRSAQRYLVQKAGTNSLSLSFERKKVNLISGAEYAIVSKLAIPLGFQFQFIIDFFS